MIPRTRRFCLPAVVFTDRRRLTSKAQQSHAAAEANRPKMRMVSHFLLALVASHLMNCSDKSLRPSSGPIVADVDRSASSSVS